MNDAGEDNSRVEAANGDGILCWQPNPSPLYVLFRLLFLRPEYGADILLRSLSSGTITYVNAGEFHIDRFTPKGEMIEWGHGHWRSSDVAVVKHKSVAKRRMIGLAFMRWLQLAVGGGVIFDVVLSLYLLIAHADAPFLKRALLFTPMFSFGFSIGAGFLIGFLPNILEAALVRYTEFVIQPHSGDSLVFLCTEENTDAVLKILSAANVPVGALPNISSGGDG